MTKPKKTSAGLLLFRVREEELQVFIAHMGGPFWAKKDEGGWSIVKGEYDEHEDPFVAACREFVEETGNQVPDGDPLALGEIKQPSGKRIAAWAIESDFDPEAVKSNSFTIEWPRGSGRHQEFPEIDRADWFDAATARRKLVKGQIPFIELLENEMCAAGRVTLAESSTLVEETQHSLF